MSMLLPPFELHEPETIEEAARIAQEYNGSSDFLAGGTDLLPNYKWGLNPKPHVISLHRVDELREVIPTRLGALARLVDLERSATLKSKLPVLPKTANLVASPLIRHSATLGGNLLLDNRCFYFNQSFHWRESKGFCLKADGDKCLVVPQKEKCYATFSADLPAPLITLDAEYELVSGEGRRRLKAREFYEGDGIMRHRKKAGELLAFVHLPEDAQEWRADYAKLRLRDSWDFPEMGIAAAIKLDAGGSLEGFRLVANALEMTPVILDDAGQDHLGRPLDDAAIDAIAAEVENRVRPVRNTFFAPSYRKRMTRVFTRRVLKGLVAESATH